MLDVKTQYEIAIAALLHDIGKFKQRAYGGKEDILSKEVKTMEALLLPVREDGSYSHRHALWTYSAIIDDIAPCFRGNQFLELINIEKIARLAAEHHRPSQNDSISKVIERADKISAGNDRAYQGEYKKGSYIVRPLRPIFSSLSLSQAEESRKSIYSYPLKSLSERGALFPIVNKDVSNQEYKDLYDKFLDSLSKAVVSIQSYEHLLFKLKDLLYEYTWCIPSATNDYLNDISLYDHSITTMSIALALANNEKECEEVRVCSFCVSGIQSFIFQSKSASFKNAAKIFRGRSFIISAFTTIVKKAICDKLGIIPFVDVLDAGGKMTLILPSNINSDSLEKLQKEMEKHLLGKYFGTLSIAMDFSSPINLESLGKGKFIKQYEKIGENLKKKKYLKFRTALESKDFIIEEDLGKKVCIACGKHDTADGNYDFCSVCNEELKLGGNVTKNTYIIFSSFNGQCEILPNYYISICENDNASFNKENYVFSLSHDDIYPEWRLNNYVPLDMEKDFVSIANKAISEDGFGKPFLGYLKIDVDSLGKLITEGIPVSEYSISRFSTLSRSLHYFFNVYLYHLLEQEYQYTYTVLSGGDDVFLILPWNQVLSLVARIKKDFSKFCCQNPELHFSAGIVISDPKTPFSFVNRKANHALELRAKEFDGKNAISYFDTTFSLDELDDFISDCNELKSYIRKENELDKPISHGLLYRLYQYASTRIDEKATLIDKYGIYSKLHYDLARNLQPKRNEDKDIYLNAMNFILDKFNNYSSEEELKKLKVMIIHNIYSSRKTKELEE